MPPEPETSPRRYSILAQQKQLAIRRYMQSRESAAFFSNPSDATEALNDLLATNNNGEASIDTHLSQLVLSGESLAQRKKAINVIGHCAIHSPAFVGDNCARALASIAARNPGTQIGDQALNAFSTLLTKKPELATPELLNSIPAEATDDPAPSALKPMKVLLELRPDLASRDLLDYLLNAATNASNELARTEARDLMTLVLGAHPEYLDDNFLDKITTPIWHSAYPEKVQSPSLLNLVAVTKTCPSTAREGDVQLLITRAGYATTPEKRLFAKKLVHDLICHSEIDRVVNEYMFRAITIATWFPDPDTWNYMTDTFDHLLNTHKELATEKLISHLNFIISPGGKTTPAERAAARRAREAIFEQRPDLKAATRPNPINRVLAGASAALKQR